MAGGNRACRTALLASLLVHALVLFTQLPASRRLLESVPAPLMARLMQVEPEPEKPPERRETPPPPPPRVERPKPVPAPEVKPVPSPVAPPVPSAPSAPPEPPQERSVSPAPPAPVAGVQPPAPSDPPFAQTLAQYRLQLLGAASAFNRYPPLARENNWEGTVEVQLRFRADGRLASLAVKASSGHRILDERALDMFRQAQQQVPVPAALRGKEFSLELKAIYRLKDQESS